MGRILIFGKNWSMLFFGFALHPFFFTFREGGYILPGDWNFTFHISHSLPFRLYFYLMGHAFTLLKQTKKPWRFIHYSYGERK